MDDTTQSTPLFKRSDGHFEDGKGNFALVMTAVTQVVSIDGEHVNRLRFQASFTAPTMQVDWPRGETVTLLPQQIINALISKGYARLPTDVEVRASYGIAGEHDLRTEEQNPVADAVQTPPENAAPAAETPAPASTPAQIPASTPAPPASASTGENKADAPVGAPIGSAPAADDGAEATPEKDAKADPTTEPAAPAKPPEAPAKE